MLFTDHKKIKQLFGFNGRFDNQECCEETYPDYFDWITSPFSYLL